MNAKAEEPTNYLDVLKWLVVVAVILGGAYANSYYAAVVLIYRVLAGIVVVGIAVAIAMQTEQGRSAWALGKEARVEVRKVVWPTREETTQTTLIVVVIVFIVGLLLWGLDSGLSWGVQSTIG
jgi:preprotein translocase subunit SecE